MTKQTARLIYKPDSQSTDEYLMFVNPAEVRRRRGPHPTLLLSYTLIVILC
jgi:hypothetical protein